MWKETTPFIVPLAPSVDHAMRSSGTCSLVVAFQLRFDHQIFACQSDVVSSALLALFTPLAKVLKSWYCVHWSYAVRSGTPTSMCSMMTVGLLPEDFLRLPLPPPRFFRAPLTLSLAWPAPSSTAVRSGPLPSASFLPPSVASLAKPGLLPSAMSLSLPVVSPSFWPTPESSRVAWAVR